MVASVTLWDSDADRCRRLADRLRATSAVPVTVGRPGPGCDLAVNATPLGMRADDPLPIAVKDLRPGALVANAVRRPPVTPLLEKALAHGCQVQPGRHMLDAQIGALWHFLDLPVMSSPSGNGRGYPRLTRVRVMLKA